MDSEQLKFSLNMIKEELRLLQEELFIIKAELEAIKIEIKEGFNDMIKPNFTHKSSIGNEGVPTNQQTDKPSFNTPSFPVDGVTSILSNTSPPNPTDNPTHIQHTPYKIQQMTPEIVQGILNEEITKMPTKWPTGTKKNPVFEITEVMNLLKSDLKRKFKSLTRQEFYIFSILYTVEKSQETITYGDLAEKTGLTGSSIRDYIQRIIRKGIPIIKEKVNNKITTLKVPPELRNLATLDNLMRLRDDFKDESLKSF